MLVQRLLSLTAVACAAVLPNQITLSDHETHHYESGFHFPTVRESAILARRMLRLERTGTLSTVFPSNNEFLRSSKELHSRESRPEDVANVPFGLIEYIADCEPDTGNPTILQVDVSTSFKNAKAGSNITLSIAWHPPGKAEGEYSGARLPRYALMGWLEEMKLNEQEEAAIRACYHKTHPDTFWYPGNDIHTSRWVRLVVEEFYWFGGFGDRARIQWIDTETWRDITREEIADARLPGEKGGSDDYQMWAHEL